MLVRANIAAVRETRWYQYAVRFVLGGMVTAAAGLIAKKYGPSVGGIFLAFPAILPASATLIEKHEREHSAQQGVQGIRKARQAVAADAAGAELGALALILFGVIVWQMLPVSSAGLTIFVATISWLIASVALWFARKRHLHRRLFPFHNSGGSQAHAYTVQRQHPSKPGPRRRH